MSDRQTVNALERAWRRLTLMVGRGRIKIGNDAGNVQTQQVQFNDHEVHDNVPRVGQWGFASMPLPNCQALVIFVGGERTQGVVIGTNDETHRLKNLQPGEVAIYDDQGQSVYIKRTGIVINGGGKQVTITNTPTVRMETNLKVTGSITDLCDGATPESMNDMRVIYDGHTHSDPQGSVTGSPNQPM